MHELLRSEVLGGWYGLDDRRPQQLFKDIDPSVQCPRDVLPSCLTEDPPFDEPKRVAPRCDLRGSAPVYAVVVQRVADLRREVEMLGSPLPVAET